MRRNCYLYNSPMKNSMQLERDTGEKTLKFLKYGYTTLYFSISLLKNRDRVIGNVKKNQDQ